MTPAERQALRALCEKATPGPWEIAPWCDGEDNEICAPEVNDLKNIIVLGQRGKPEDMHFIAAAGTAIPVNIPGLEVPKNTNLNLNGGLWHEITLPR